MRQIRVNRTFYERAIMLDTGPLISLYHPQDERGKAVQKILRLANRDKIPLYITQLTIAETHRRILYDIGYKPACKFVNDINDKTTRIIEANIEDSAKAIEIITRFTDQKITFTDAITMALMLRLGIKNILTFDRHFFLLNFSILSTNVNAWPWSS